MQLEFCFDKPWLSFLLGPEKPRFREVVYPDQGHAATNRWNQDVYPDVSDSQV